MRWESFAVVRFDLGPLVQGQTAVAKLKSAHISLIIGPRGLACETNPYENMCWESFDVVRFDLVPLVQGQTTMPKLKSAYILLIIGLTIGQTRMAKLISAYIELIIASRGLRCKTHFKQHIFAPWWEIIPLQWSCFLNV